MNRLESLVDAFANMNAMSDPKSRAYQNRNPLLLKAFSPKHAKDADGYRIFRSFVSGYDNALIDLTIKCSGRSRFGLTPESPLVDLVKVFGNPATAATFIVRFLRKALGDESLTDTLPLKYFMEKE